MHDLILQVKQLSCYREKGDPILSNIDLSIYEGDVLVIQGQSGSGKTTLLKCLAHLRLYDGEIYYRTRWAVRSMNIPKYRTRVMYIPQRPSLLLGTPLDFLKTISSFSARTGIQKPSALVEAELIEKATNIASGWGIDTTLWDRNWNSLSGGESQRIALASALGCNVAEVLLLDEPTSALDPNTSLLVEEDLVKDMRASDTALKAIVWITHSEEQGGRVGTRHIQISSSGCSEALRPKV